MTQNPKTQPRNNERLCLCVRQRERESEREGERETTKTKQNKTIKLLEGINTDQGWLLFSPQDQHHQKKNLMHEEGR